MCEGVKGGRVRGGEGGGGGGAYTQDHRAV